MAEQCPFCVAMAMNARSGRRTSQRFRFYALANRMLSSCTWTLSVIVLLMCPIGRRSTLCALTTSGYNDDQHLVRTFDFSGEKRQVVENEESQPGAGDFDGTNVDDDTEDNSNRWCQYNSGPVTIPDHRTGRRHDAHISLRRDGSVWVRVGSGQLDLAAVNERRRRIQTTVLDDSAVEALRFLLSRRKKQPQRSQLQQQQRRTRMNSTSSSSSSSSSLIDRCALTDIDLSLTVAGGWNPSYVVAFDAEAGGRLGRGGADVRIFSMRNIRDECKTSASVFLSADKQTIRCDGGSLPSGSINVCSQRVVPERTGSVVPMASSVPSSGSGTSPSQPSASTAAPTGRVGLDWSASSTWFIKYISMDPNGTDHWYCRQHEERNRFSLTGSYYYAYVKVANCPPPVDSRSLGDEITLRPHTDTWRNMILIPDPTKTVLSDSIIQGWQIYVKAISIEHNIYLQVWRPTSSHTTSSTSTTSTPRLPVAATTPEAPSNVTITSSGLVYSLVGQTYIEANELRFREIVLRADQFIRVSRGDVLAIYFPNLNPIGWSSVPCSSSAQRFAFVRAPKIFTVGTSLSFRSAAQPSMTAASSAGSGDLCRYYSLAALFANRTRSKLVVDHHCPPVSAAMDQHFQPTFRGTVDTHHFVSTSSRNPSTMVRNLAIPGSRARDSVRGTSEVRVPTDRHRNDDSIVRSSLAARDLSDAFAAAAAAVGDGGSLAVYYALLVVACILLAMAIVGTMSYCVASRTSPTNHPPSNILPSP